MCDIRHRFEVRQSAQLKFRIAIVSQIYMTRRPVWQLPLNAELLQSDPSVYASPRHYIETKITLNFPIGKQVDDCRLDSTVQETSAFCAHVTTN